MSPTQKISQFLFILDVRRGETEVVELGTDLDAYEAAEEEHRGDTNWTIVLVGSDSIDTVRKTHASYFGTARRDLGREVERELAVLKGGR